MDFTTVHAGLTRQIASDELPPSEEILALQRALTIRDMGTADMRAAHDTVPAWAFEDPKDLPPFTPGTVRMEREDAALALTQFYELMGWDTATGAPTRAAYARLGLGDVGRALAARGLVPGEKDKT